MSAHDPADRDQVSSSDEPTERELEMLLDEHPDARVAAVDRNGLFVPMPPSLPLSGQVELTARTLVNLVIPEDWATVIEAWERCRETGSATGEARLTDGTTVRAHLFDVRDTHGDHIVVLVDEGATHDDRPGPRTVAPERPRLSRVRKNELAVVVDVDRAAEITFGWTSQEFVGRRTLDLLHPEDRDLGIRNWIEMLTSPGLTQRWKGRHQCADGSYRWMEFVNTNLLEESEGVVLCEMIDIAEEMEAREALVASESLFKGLAEALPLGVAQVQLSGAVVFSNGRLAQMMGGTDLSVIADLRGRLAPEGQEQFDRAWAALIEEREGIDGEFELADARTLELIARPLVSPDGSRMTGAVLCLSDVSDRVQSRRDLEHRARIDPLTGALNRHAIEAHLRAALQDGSSAGVAVVFIDIDAFKRINDDLGHAVGDDALTEIGARLRAAVRARGDQVGRIGGDEFIVVCSGVRDGAQAEELCSRIARRLSVPPQYAGDRPISASAGVAWSDDPLVSAGELLRRADKAMYRVKGRRDPV